MRYFSRVVLIGAVSVLVFDALASVASRQLGFAYAFASVGSWTIYAAVGSFATRAGGRIQTAALAGATMGLVDATAGWAISWALGPGHLPAGTLTPGRWMAAAIFVVLTGAVLGALGALGGLGGRSVRSIRTRSSTGA